MIKHRVKVYIRSLSFADMRHPALDVKVKVGSRAGYGEVKVKGAEGHLHCRPEDLRVITLNS